MGGIANGEACLTGASTADVLRLLSAGATGAILMALGEGPLRTMELTQRVPGYSPRTIYRYAGRLSELEVVDREEEPGVPSKVVVSLTDPCGSELHDLVEAFAAASLTRLPNGQIDVQAWASLGLLADLWESGMAEELSCEPRSPTELARAHPDWSYHQVNRRAGLLKTAGLLSESPGLGRRRLYELTDKTRGAMALITGIGRWRHHHVLAADEEGMTAAEMATVLRTALPLVRSPEFAGRNMQMSVLGSDEAGGGNGEVVWSRLEDDGAIHSCASPTSSVHGSARGAVKGWISAILAGDPSGLQLDGDQELVGTCIEELHDALWHRSASPVR